MVPNLKIDFDLKFFSLCGYCQEYEKYFHNNRYILLLQIIVPQYCNMYAAIVVQIFQNIATTGNYIIIVSPALSIQLLS